MRYLFIVFLAILLIVFNIVTGNIGLTAGLSHLLDLVSMLFIIIVTIPVILVTGLHKDFINAFRLTVGKTKAKSILELKRAKEAIILTGRTVVCTGIISTCLGAITVLYEIDTLDMLGPNLAVCLLCTFYASLLYLLFIPIHSKLEVLIAEFMQE